MYWHLKWIINNSSINIFITIGSPEEPATRPWQNLLSKIWAKWAARLKKEAILQAKWAVNLLRKSKMGKEWVHFLLNHLLESSKAIGFRLVLLVQLSSAAAERVFSILQQLHSSAAVILEDYLELSVMLQYS